MENFRHLLAYGLPHLIGDPRGRATLTFYDEPERKKERGAEFLMHFEEHRWLPCSIGNVF